MQQPKSPSVLYVSTFPPRECGIATFTQDLTNAIDREFAPAVKSKILAMNVNGSSLYNYPKKVALQISDSDIDDYLSHAKEINDSPDIKLVCIQHEYGIYGGEWGNYILPFMEMLTKPIVVTFHTVLPRPGRELKRITKQIVEKANGIVVMTEHSATLLRRTYGIDKKKPIAVIPHGVHHIQYPSKSKAKAKLNLSGRTILSTFGMLNRDKGIEYAIEALPEIIKKYPDTLYLILGATHPVVARHEGESYRNKLTRLVKKLGLDEHVKFYNKYLELDELIDFLKATDIYISPTLNPKQAVSGTISYAFSCACPIVATANQYAKDTINKERGILVDFANSKAIETALMTMLDDPIMTKNMKKDCYFYSRHMTWQNVSLAYFKFFDQFTPIIPRDKDKLPPIRLDHIRHMTDDFGMIQFAVHTKPDIHSGYCLDDNSRALIGAINYNDRYPKRSVMRLINTYFNYIKFSQKEDTGAFKDFVNRAGEVSEDRDLESQDSFGRAIWSLGQTLVSKRAPNILIEEALGVFDKAYPLIVDLQFSRSIAFALIGLTDVHRYFSLSGNLDRREEIARMIKRLSDTLIGRYEEQTGDSALAGEKWLWFDDHLTYSNYKIPEALFRAYRILNKDKYKVTAEHSIDFLNKITFEKGYYNAIGQDGWYFRNGKRAYFDQQPEDAASAVEALVAAYEVTGKEKYAADARDAFNWFLGKNHLNQMIYDDATGGCYDGLGKKSINFNQGAESTLSYFLARLAVEAVYKDKEGKDNRERQLLIDKAAIEAEIAKIEAE